MIRVGIAYIVIAWLVAQVADLVLDTFNAPDWVMQTILLMLALGLPLTVVFAWAFELTPEGIKKEQDVDRNASVTHKTVRKLDLFIIGVLVVALGYFIWESRLAERGEQTAAVEQTAEESSYSTALPAGTASVAVLPFAHRSAQDDDQYFTDGIHDDLLTQLAKIRDLTVISRTSMMRYRDTEKTIPQIAKELGVAMILEGGVQRAGTRIRINAQLIEAATDAHLWSETYDREMTVENLFDIQSEITREIVNAVQGQLSGAAREALIKAPTDNLEAYQAYLLGLRLSEFVGATLPRLQAAIESFEQAIGLDADFSEAHAALTYANILAYWSQGHDTSFRDAAAAALKEAQRLAPNSVATLKVQGFYHYWGFLNFDEALQAFDRALQLSPGSADIWAGKAYVERRTGLFQSALVSLQKAQRLDPGNVEYVYNVLRTASQTGQFELANRSFDQLKLLTDSTVFLQANESFLWWLQGDCDKAWAAIAADVSNAPSWFHQTRMVSAYCTRDDTLVQQTLDGWEYDSTELESTPYIDEMFRAGALQVLGRFDDANAILERVQALVDQSENPYPAGWSPNASYWPIALPWLRHDVEGIHQAVKDFESQPTKDRFFELQVIPTIAAAYAIAGETELALDFLERYRAMPWMFAQVTINPYFDAIREHPRYQVLKTGYETWKAGPR